jgi:hypothetical protein
MTIEIYDAQSIDEQHILDKTTNIPQAHASNVSPLENAKLDDLTFDATSTFSSLIARAINLGSGYRQKSREVSAAHYAVAHKYHTDELIANCTKLS